MNPNALQQYAADPVLFVSDVLAGTGRPLTDYQRTLMESLAPSLLALKAKQTPPVRRYWVEQTKGAGKDTILAAVVLWLLAFCPWPMFGQVGAVDQAQADELRKALAEFVRTFGWLAQLVTVKASKIANSRTDALVEVVPADAPGSHGARPDLLILNEICHHPSEEFASNMMDNATKVDRNLTIIATNAGSIDHWSYAWRELARESARWSFQQYAKPAPWIDAAELAEAEKRNPHSRFRRLFHGEWSSGNGDAFDENLIASSCTLSAPHRRRPGVVFVAGLDLGVRRDHTALVVIGKSVGYMEERIPDRPKEPMAIAALRDLGYLDYHDPDEVEEIWHPGSNRIELAAVKIWRPTKGRPVDLSDVERTIVDLHREFRLEAVAVDAWQAEFLSQRLNQHGVPTIPVSMTGPVLTSMANTLLGQFQEKTIDLYPDPDLLADLRASRIVEKSYGIRLESPRDQRGHGDVLTGLALAIWQTRQLRANSEIRNRKLVLYP